MGSIDSTYLPSFLLGVKLTKTHVAPVSWDSDPWLFLDCIFLVGMGSLHSLFESRQRGALVCSGAILLRESDNYFP